MLNGGIIKRKTNTELCLALLLAGSVGLLAGVGTNLLYQQGSDRLTVYQTNSQQRTTEPAFFVNFPQQGTPKEKLQELASLLARSKFCELPIEVTGLKDSIATVDLKEHPWNQPLKQPPTLPGCSGMTWRYQYFQGSAGGHDTSVTLAQTFLQPEYRGNWIQGVQFSYEGQLIQPGQWDHLEIDGVVTRERMPEH
jgi:hypothetical protein